MRLNKLKIWVIPQRPFPSQAVFGICQQHFRALLLSTPSPTPPLRRGQCPVMPQVVPSAVGMKRQNLS